MPDGADRRSVAARAAGVNNLDELGQQEYVRQVLEAYRKTPGTTGAVRRADRMLAAQLYERGLSVRVIENALVLAAMRRLARPPDAPPLGTIRSLAYFLPVIEEVLELRVSPDYFDYLRHKLARAGLTR
jgi:hypothetical protein